MKLVRRKLQITRDGTELGTLTEAEVRDLLRIGFLLPCCMKHRRKLLGLDANEICALTDVSGEH